MARATSTNEGQGNFFGWVSQLVHDNRAKLARLARREGVHGADAFDVIQEAFIGFLQLPQARSLAGDAAAAARVLSILTRNIARNLRRRHHRAKPHLSEVQDVDCLDEDTASVDELVETAEQHVRLVGCVAQLTRVRRRVVTLRLLEDVKGEVVARMLGITQGHVATLLHRAKEDLRDCMERGEADMTATGPPPRRRKPTARHAAAGRRGRR